MKWDKNRITKLQSILFALAALLLSLSFLFSLDSGRDKKLRRPGSIIKRESRIKFRRDLPKPVQEEKVTVPSEEESEDEGYEDEDYEEDEEEDEEELDDYYSKGRDFNELYMDD